MPVIIEFSRCIGTYSSAKFEYIRKRVSNESVLLVLYIIMGNVIIRNFITNVSML